MPRLLFEKRGNAIWISHLDLMRLFQRAFKRAGYALTHTQGYNPRPSVSIALPLSVGVESCCELLDFDLEGEMGSFEEFISKLNKSLVDGITVRDVYTDGRKIRDLLFLRSEVVLEYDATVPVCAVDRITELLNSQDVSVVKKTKSGLQDQNIIPMIRSVMVSQPTEHTVSIDVVHCCQNPTLNPMQIPLAIEKYLPDIKADFSKCRRIEVLDGNMQIFR